MAASTSARLYYSELTPKVLINRPSRHQSTIVTFPRMSHREAFVLGCGATNYWAKRCHFFFFFFDALRCINVIDSTTLFVTYVGNEYAITGPARVVRNVSHHGELFRIPMSVAAECVMNRELNRTGHTNFRQGTISQLPQALLYISSSVINSLATARPIVRRRQKKKYCTRVLLYDPLQ
jgi:hypothetical protein